MDRDVIRLWLAWGFVWLLTFPTLGAVLATKFTDPGFLGGVPWLTFGRLRPVHVNGVIWGAFSTLFLGLAYWVVPRLCGVTVWRSGWGRPLAWVWNLNLVAASAALLAGGNRGWEAGELPLANVLVLFGCLAAIAVQLLMTIARRAEPQLYVSLWYLIAGLVWTVANLVLLVVGPGHVPGVGNAAWHGLFIHYVVGLWITPAGYVLIYYFLPAALHAPIYSHRLSLIGFWSLAFFYPFVGLHHYLYAPIAEWAQTIAIVSSMLLIIPVWTVLQNFFGTMLGRWDQLGRNLPGKFLVTGSLFYLVGCTQGALAALRSVQEPTHFTDFVVAHSHLTIFGTFILWTLGGALYVWPRLHGAPLASFRVANWGYWLVTLGVAAMGGILSAQGLLQGFMLMSGVEFLDSVDAMRPFWWARTFTGIAMDVGASLLVLTLARTSGARRAA
ncbi:MAG: cbb3-type cytochrome c oxidase subunit I [Candidatus Rokuibacteriota bacterium]